MNSRFKRLTGRHEMAVSARDYKFYSPRHKYRRVGSQSLSNIHELSPLNQQQSASKHHIQPIQHQPQFHSLRQSHQQPLHQSHHVAHFSHSHQFVPSPQLPDIPQSMQALLAVSCMGGKMQVLQIRLLQGLRFDSSSIYSSSSSITISPYR
ncbi:hypothetical protein AQUCO_04100188v1 [Aquilegia coerulea]|uniref:Uncharacterized protein n=1 Tax=Aquilegia coerulea TaxID=218851 RepID=A0A2G5CQJ2_AQUCA|nr:hypothetical protein AQUCO_04100188v1 [Aquilegia coerulea]